MYLHMYVYVYVYIHIHERPARSTCGTCERLWLCPCLAVYMYNLALSLSRSFALSLSLSLSRSLSFTQSHTLFLFLFCLSLSLSPCASAFLPAHPHQHSIVRSPSRVVPRSLSLFFRSFFFPLFPALFSAVRSLSRTVSRSPFLTWTHTKHMQVQAYHVMDCSFGVPKVEILKSHLPTQFALVNHCSADFWEFLDGIPLAVCGVCSCVRVCMCVWEKWRLAVHPEVWQHSQKSARYWIRYVKRLQSWLLRISSRHGMPLAAYQLRCLEILKSRRWSLFIQWIEWEADFVRICKRRAICSSPQKRNRLEILKSKSSSLLT